VSVKENEKNMLFSSFLST